MLLADCLPVKSTSDGRRLRRPKAQVTLPPAVEETEPLQKLYNLLEAKEFKTRMEGVALLLDLCKSSPQLVSTNTVQIFDYFVPRLGDTHKKVKQKALDVLAEIIGILKDGLNPVIICLVEGITNNLNSKDPGVYAAAVKALEESMAHLDKVSLMKEFSHRRSELKGQGLLDVTEHLAALVAWVYPRSPEVVQRYALPVLWSFLGNKALPVRSANVRTVVTKLACALYKVMGAKLRKHAASQPPHVRENLSDILGW
ncbi:TOG array regulator of axonemal microtubules protein 2-like [Corvus hawaiiensis]|uniref:TOG array regulator of axonemal microtubules protein 2-like n=1 Tax=Corvus hawaiiensis TaxID=134902 RepID=UPI0020184984|nr:TOG array regulator of axonemal microtubules protein 2-like [Corvus hawaiiensis]